MSDALSSYDILQQESGIERSTGEWYGRRVLSLTRADIDNGYVQEVISESTENKWPDTTGLYAPCIHQCQIVPFPRRSGFYKATLHYRRPTREMILRPGRGLLSFDSYTTTIKKEIGVFRDGREQTIYNNIPSTDWAMYTVTIERKDVLEVEERGLVIVDAAEPYTKERSMYQRMMNWIGKGGQFIIGTIPNVLVFSNLKCAKIQAQRRPTDLSVIDMQYQFARKSDPWKESGVIQQEWYATDLDGAEVVYDPNTDPPTIPEGTFMAVKLHNMDSDVINGIADFTPISEYFKWMDA